MLLWLVPPIMKTLVTLRTLVPVIRIVLLALGVSRIRIALVRFTILILDRFMFIALIRTMLKL